MPDQEGHKPPSNMRQRVLTALVGIPVVLAVLCARSPWPLGLLAAALFLVGSWELTKMTKASEWVMGHAVLLCIPAAYWMPPIMSAYLGVGLVGVLLASPKRSGISYLAVGWLAGPLSALVWLQSKGVVGTTPTFSPNLVLMAVVPLWAGDTAAIFAGRALGKTPLAPKISPKKTVEGGIANLLACVAAALALCPLLHLDLVTGALCGAVCGVIGQVGDLIESALKRRFDVKDSGTILPGHGGVLDRIDSILLTAVPVASILLGRIL